MYSNDAENSRDQEGYNPAYKYDLSYKALVANTNSISDNYDKNQVVDDSYWPHCGYGEDGSVICGRLSQNKKFAKGGQTVMCMDAGRFRILLYIHRHKLYNHKKQSWSAAGPYKLYIFQCDFLEMVRGSMSSKRKLFHEEPTTTVDNYFVTDVVLDWSGNWGILIISTNVRDCLPKDVKSLYLHK